MGKISKKKATASKSPSKAPSRAPASTGGKKRTSAKAATSGGGILGALTDVMSSGNLPPLPSIASISGSSSMKYNPMTGMMHRKKHRKGLSASDIKGFMRVNKFAGMLTKVSGHKHHVITHRKRK